MNLCIKHAKKLFQYSSAEMHGKVNKGDSYLEYNTDSVLRPIHKQRWIYATVKLLLERVIHAYSHDISKLRSLGWEPQYDLGTTLSNAMKYYLKHS